MKKLKSFIAIILVLFLSGCGLNDPKYISLSKKDGNDYYTKELKSKIIQDNNFSVTVFDTNLYKDLKVDDIDKQIIKEFLKSTTSENFNEPSSDVGEDEVYRIIITCGDDKYQLKVFSENLVILSPWDGNYAPDFINFQDIPKRYNLLDFCNYIKNNIAK